MNLLGILSHRLRFRRGAVMFAVLIAATLAPRPEGITPVQAQSAGSLSPLTSAGPKGRGGPPSQSSPTPIPTTTAPTPTPAPVSAPTGHYLFGTLLTDSSKAAQEYAAGVRVAHLELGWDAYEPQDGV